LRPNKRKYVHVTRRLEIVCRRAYGDHYASWTKYCRAIAHSLHSHSNLL
jgi:hypothetical protein